MYLTCAICDSFTSLFQFVTQCVVGMHGRAESDVYDIAQEMDVLAMNPYHVTQDGLNLALGEDRVFGAPEWINEIDKVRGPFNVGVLQQVAATVMLDHYDELKRHAALMVAERERLFTELQKLPGVTPFPSKANFVLTRFPDAAAVFEGLKARGILVRNLSAMHPLMANTLRISVGTSAEMDAFLNALKEICS